MNLLIIHIYKQQYYRFNLSDAENLDPTVSVHSTPPFYDHFLITSDIISSYPIILKHPYKYLGITPEVVILLYVRTYQNDIDLINLKLKIN